MRGSRCLSAVSVGVTQSARGGAASQMSRRIPQIIHLTAFALLCCATIYRVILIGWGWPTFGSDQAIIGLMARHIWLYGEHPLFFYGQDYMGPGEAYVAVPFFALLGSSALSLRLAMLPLTLLFLLEMYALGRVAYGPAAGLLTLAWLTVGPSIAVYRGLTAEGGAQEALALGGLILLCVWLRLRSPEPRPATRRAWLACIAVYGLLGIACGWALWPDWLIVPLPLLAALVLLLARPREMLSWAGAALLLGFTLAAWPFLQFNATYQFASLNQALHFSGADHGSLGAHLAGVTAQFPVFGAIDLPAIFGSPLVCGAYPADVTRYRWMAELGALGDRCAQVNELFSVLILAIFALAAWPVLSAVGARLASLGDVWGRRKNRRQTPPVSSAAAQRSAQLWLRGVMLLNALTLALAFINNSLNQAYPLDKSRYLLPLYLSAPLFFGALWDAMRPLVMALGRAWRRDRASASRSLAQSGAVPATQARPVRRQQVRRQTLALAAGAMLALLLGLSVSNGVAMLSDATDSAAYSMPVDPPWIAPILTIFDTYHVRTFYAESYYDCYRIAFESNERQVCAVLGPNGQPAPETWLNRYTPYVTAVARDPHPAYLLYASSTEQSAFARGPLPARGYVRTTLGSFAIYLYAKPPADSSGHQ